VLLEVMANLREGKVIGEGVEIDRVDGYKVDGYKMEG
jgi:hypothetical protein